VKPGHFAALERAPEQRRKRLTAGTVANRMAEAQSFSAGAARSLVPRDVVVV